MTQYVDNLFGQYVFRCESYWLNVGQVPPKEPVIVHTGELVTSFRGDEWTLEGVSRPAVGNSEGRIALERICPDARQGARYDGRSRAVIECPHMWHRNGIERREFYPSAFNLYLGTEDGGEA